MDAAKDSQRSTMHNDSLFPSQEVQVLTGDSRELLRDLPSESAQCCITSPPYWGLRDYDHPAQIGAELSPKQYVTNLVEIFRGVRRVLRKDGTLWLNVGDGLVENEI